MRVFFIPKMRGVILPFQLRPSTEAFFLPLKRGGFYFHPSTEGNYFHPLKRFVIYCFLTRSILDQEIRNCNYPQKKKEKNNDGWKLKTPVPHARSYEFAQYLWNLFEIIFESLFSKNSKARFFKWKSWIIQVLSLQIKQAFLRAQLILLLLSM